MEYKILSFQKEDNHKNGIGKYISCITWLLISVMIITAIIHIVFSYYENDYLSLIKKNKTNYINRIKKNLRFYNKQIIQVKNDREIFINLVHKKYGISLQGEYYIND